VTWIYIRRTLDWADEAVFRAQIPERMRNKVALWDATFTMPFHIFRARVKAIAQANLAQVEDVTVTDDWDAIPEGALVLPCDDDDWFRPDAARVVGARVAARPGHGFYVWTASFVERPVDAGHALYIARRTVAPWSWERWKMSTNNYALFKSEDARELADSHTEAHRSVVKGSRTRDKFRGRLSAMNRSLASATTLSHDWVELPEDVLLRKFRAYRRYYRRPPRGLQWAAPYVRQMRDLTAELELRPERPRGWRRR
jgi:hypothetical protein